ncbi:MULTISPECIES: restriction endonuclease subunit S [unclassified Psychrobacter]|uniref:restriction endonuclease subunit S n=1 Tax=unclassified Psychrobacter TaxID=196806 RepID=UPI0025F77A8B|nr:MULTISPECIES: restriction endonuclease subunit S [unclassified Psychrobacter]
MSNQLTTLAHSKVEFIDGDRGKNYPNKSQLLTSGYCVFLNTSNVRKGWFDFSKVEFIDEVKDKELRKGKVKNNDLILTTRGTVGNVALITEDIPFENIRINSGMVIVRTTTSTLNPYFLLLFFRSNLFEKQCLSHGSGSAQPQLPISALKYISLPDLDIKYQEKIVSTIRALDKKIEINNQINAELEAIVKTLYDYWFVQFDFPNADGKPYKSTGGKVVYNEVLKREIPEGWKDSTLWNIAIYYNGLAMQKYRATGDEYLPVIKIREMNNGISSDTEKAKVDIPKAAVIEDGDLLFSWSATLDVKIWSEGKGALNQHIFKVTSDTYPQSFYYFELMNYLSHFKMMADLRKTTMGHITLEHLKQANIVLPPIELIEKLDEKLKPIFEHILVLKKESNSLVKLRDWLLPMLMNGQVTVT